MLTTEIKHKDSTTVLCESKPTEDKGELLLLVKVTY